MTKQLTHGALFNGIGGFQLAAEWVGWENVFSCEIDDFCNKITKHHYPNCTQHTDIKTTDFTQYEDKIDILTGGFPCQPFSVAGKRLGTADNRNLWAEMYRAVKEIKPTYIVAENVRGIISWNGGLVFDQVQTDLENEGYEVATVILPATSVNAPHRRDRVWFVAHRADTRAESVQQDGANRIYRLKSATHPKKSRTRRLRIERETTRTPDSDELLGGKRPIPDWHNFPTQSPVCRRDDGISPRLDGITFPKWRRNSLKAYGNAIVPQVAYGIFNIINQLNTTKMKKIQAVTTAIRETLPHLFDVVIGQIILRDSTQYQVLYVGDDFVQAQEIDTTKIKRFHKYNFRQFNKYADSLDLEFIRVMGKEPTILDVLMWAETIDKECFELYASGVLYDRGTGLDYKIDLTKPYLKDQSNEVIDSLYELMNYQLNTTEK